MCWARHDLVWEPHRWADHRFDTSERAASNLRVSDADREAVIGQLRRHTADGRLTLDEFEDRVEEALQARTGRDLQEVLRDLPRQPAPAARRRSSRPVSPVLVAGAVVLAVSLAIGHVVLWPVFVVLGLFAFGGCHQHGMARVNGREARPLHRRDDRAVTVV